MAGSPDIRRHVKEEIPLVGTDDHHSIWLEIFWSEGSFFMEFFSSVVRRHSILMSIADYDTCTKIVDVYQAEVPVVT